MSQHFRNCSNNVKYYKVDVNESCKETHLMEQEPIIFKTPQKRKMKNKSLDVKISKTDKVQEKEMQDTESDSDSS